VGVRERRLVATGPSRDSRELSAAVTQSVAVADAIANTGDVHDRAAGPRLDVSQWRLVATRLSRYRRSVSVAVTRSIADTDTVDDVHDSAARAGLDVHEWRLVATRLSRDRPRAVSRPGALSNSVAGRVSHRAAGT
jgi:type II secretory pathway component PulJ